MLKWWQPAKLMQWRRHSASEGKCFNKYPSLRNGLSLETDDLLSAVLSGALQIRNSQYSNIRTADISILVLPAPARGQVMLHITGSDCVTFPENGVVVPTS